MAIQELDDPTTDDDDVTTHRARAKAELDQIIRQVRLALTEQGIDTPVFFIVPNSGDAIVTFGTITDPPDDQWGRVGEIVASIVAQTCGLRGTRRREVQCATTDSIADRPTEAPAQPSEPSGCQPVPMPASAWQHAGAESR